MDELRVWRALRFARAARSIRIIRVFRYVADLSSAAAYSHGTARDDLRSHQRDPYDPCRYMIASVEYCNALYLVVCVVHVLNYVRLSVSFLTKLY